MRIRGIRRRARRGEDRLQRRAAADASPVPARARNPSVKEHITRLVVDVGNRASAWRESALEAEAAFRSWTNAVQADRDDAAAVYLAALEREEKAAEEYSRALEACCSAAP
jgi:hypothetical protein